MVGIPRDIMRLNAIRVTATLAIGLLTIKTAAAADPAKGPSPWPQVRGPGGQGHADADIPTAWGEGVMVQSELEERGRGVH